jgi:hypothetical protein
MNDREFEERLLTLAFLIGEYSAADLFAEEYQALLTDVKASAIEPRRYEKIYRMKILLLRQTAYLINEWLKAKREDI